MAEDQAEENFQLYCVEEKIGEDQAGDRVHHTLLKIPHELPKRFQNNQIPSDKVFNILMADASGSMKDRWWYVVNGWQKYILANLIGRSRVYIFDTVVRKLRDEKFLYEKDFTGYSTNLTSAFETIQSEISESEEYLVNVFLITDGKHNYKMECGTPESIIKELKVPKKKKICVYVLGIGYEFPVAYSIDIRSHLHNGNSNVPTLFWAKEDYEILENISAIGAELSSSPVHLDLNVEGFVAPGTNKTKKFHLGEWVYFPQPPEDLPQFTIKMNAKNPKSLLLSCQKLPMYNLINHVFRQWNSVLIQKHRKGEHVTQEPFDLMDSLFYSALNRFKQNIESDGVKCRINTKLAKTYELEYITLKNQSKQVIDMQIFDDELKLAEAVLKTTVSNRKYDQKNLRMKGHVLEDFEADVEAFKNIYVAVKERILALPSPSLDECCKVTHASTLSDLQDPDFHMILEQDKFNLLKNLTMTGIPAFAPIRDSSQINPWTIAIRYVLGSPYDILSQNVLETSAELNNEEMDATNKSALANLNDGRTKFNIIIPLVPANAAKVLKPLVRSNLYAMLSTFCILKNPQIIDYNAHLAALSSAWILTIRNHPIDQRPEYIKRRIDNIIATASLYMSRPSIKTYLKALISDPDQALMTESIREYDGHTVKSESLVKPMFFLIMVKNRMTEKEKETMMQLILAEFLGRCLPNGAEYASSTPFTEYFAREINSPKKKQAWLESTLQSLVRDLLGNCRSLLEAYYSLDALQSAVKKRFRKKFDNLSGQLTSDNFIAIDMAKIKDLRNVGSCGDVWVTDFKVWAQELCLTTEQIKRAASPSMIAIYAVEAFRYPNSRDRLFKANITKKEALGIIKYQVIKETARSLKVELMEKVKLYTETQWKEQYLSAHKDIVMPTTPAEVVKLAQARNIADWVKVTQGRVINITPDTFTAIYKYDSRHQLLRNACQMPSCPQYLVPNRKFNQHISFERQQENFPHALHLASKAYSTMDADYVIKQLSGGQLSGTKYRKRPQPPKRNSLKPFKEQITDLMKYYDET